MRPYFYLLKLEQNVVYRSPGISRTFGGRSKAFIDRDGRDRGFSASLMTGHSCMEGCVWTGVGASGEVKTGCANVGKEHQTEK